MKTFTIVNKKGKTFEILIDDEDWDAICIHKWHVTHNYNKYKEIRYSAVKNSKFGALADFIFALHNIHKNEQIIDHIDRNPLNNQKSNLRLADSRLNSLNRNKQRQSNGKFIGVSRHAKNKRLCYRMFFRISPNQSFSALFDREELAAYAYNIMADKHKPNIGPRNNINITENEINRVLEKLYPKPKGKRTNSSSKYLGVSLDKKYNNYFSYVILNKKQIYIKGYTSEIEAAKARNQYIIDNNLQDKCTLNNLE